MQRLHSFVIVVLAGSAACGGSSPDASSRSSSSGDDASGAVEASTPAIDGGVETGGEDAGTLAPEGGVTPDGGAPCYSEPYAAGVPLDDLKSAYTSAAWLSSSLTAMQRRYPTGYFVLNAEQADTQLPGFADPSAWDALMESLMTMVHEESHGWDFDHAQGTTHPYVLLDSMQITVPPLTTWARSEITQYITDATTQQYDQTYLVGTQGTYDAVFLFEELNAYCNGLAAITAVGDQITQTISARDGVAAHLYYLELYLRAGRTAHPADYAAMAADASWMKLVRHEWARGHFWDAQARPNATLDIASAPIWAHIVEPANLAEIQKFTGEAPDAVACHP